VIRGRCERSRRALRTPRILHLTWVACRSRSRRPWVSDYVNRAKVAVEKSDLPKAKEILQIVLKVDTQHSVAKELMMEVQQRMQRQQRGEQIKQLRSHAEEAMSQKSYEDALAYAEQALTLDKTNPELINLREIARRDVSPAQGENSQRTAISRRLISSGLVLSRVRACSA